MLAKDASTPAELIAAAQAVAARLGRRSYTLATYVAESGFNGNQVRRHFGGWRGLALAAGLAPTEWRTRVPDDEIFRALRDVCLEAGGIVGRSAFNRSFRYSDQVMARRFGTWAATLARFRDWVAAEDPGFPLRAALEARIDAVRASEERRRAGRKKAGRSGPPWRSLGRRGCGAPLGWGPLLCEPTNELGVAIVFGVLAADLGYAFEAAGIAFPDMTARRRVKGGRSSGGRWEPVRVELEFRASSFVAHGHDLKGCDVIICWENDWPDCPIEVLDLKAAIERLRTKAAGPLNAVARRGRRRKAGGRRRGA
jgi:hypothetical protein